MFVNRLAQAFALAGVLSGCGPESTYTPDPNGNSNRVIPPEENDAGRFMPGMDAAQEQVEACVGAYDLLHRSVQFTYHLTRGGSRVGGSPFKMSMIAENTPQPNGGTGFPFTTRASFGGIPSGALPAVPLPGMTLGDLAALRALSEITARITGTATPGMNGCQVGMSWVFSGNGGIPFVMRSADAGVGDGGVTAYTTTNPAEVRRVLVAASSDGGSAPVGFTFTAPVLQPGEVPITGIPICGTAGTPNCATPGDQVTVDVRFGPRVVNDAGVVAPSDAGVRADGASSSDVAVVRDAAVAVDAMAPDAAATSSADASTDVGSDVPGSG